MRPNGSGSRRSPPTSSSVGSCSTSFHAASVASATTACSPVPAGRTTSPKPAACSRVPPPTDDVPDETIEVRPPCPCRNGRMIVIEVLCVGVSRAHRRFAPRSPGYSRHDPVWITAHAGRPNSGLANWPGLRLACSAARSAWHGGNQALPGVHLIHPEVGSSAGREPLKHLCLPPGRPRSTNPHSVAAGSCM